ncbi:oxygenase MpaB family protein [Leifsonia sp. Leaf264]|uniref:oxygenase MpaB family protein n=1 Tax=Leifsonia sp. Leaf264 TaxID=1736314 RepID=UPI0006FD8DAE|nr:oxygenase MpaB family protein [Leifsonia sp. Leaf264]KQO93805.1 hypothetical protein ASF30_21610 [Leifsonia sp. Leaf264]
MSEHQRGLPRFAGDGVLIAGGARAILLQLAYPPVGRGVVDHSDFAGRPLDRLWATLAYAYAIVYGTEADRVRAVRLVNRAHSPVRGEARGTAPAYSAYDPQLQLWVAATLYDTAVVVHEELFGPLDPAEADALYDAYAELGIRLQLPRGQWPADRAAFAEYWAQMLPRLSVDADVHAVSRQLMFARSLPAPLGLAMPLARLVTAGLLPDAVRSAYGIRWTARAERRFRRTLAITGLLWPWLPVSLRQWPQRRSLAIIRRG